MSGGFRGDKSVSENINVQIAGVGVYMPPQIRVNDDLNYETFGVERMWIRAGGYKAHRVADSCDTTVSMAVEAADGALRMASMPAEQLDLVIFVNSTFDADCVMPAGAPRIAADLGATQALAFTMKETCYGFILAMDQAARMIQSGLYQNVLITTAEIFSRHVDPSSKLNIKLSLSMGDGAGAVVLKAAPGGEAGLLGSFVETRGDLSGDMAMQTKMVYTMQEGMKHGIFYGFRKSRDNRRDSRNKNALEKEFDNIKDITLAKLPLAVDRALGRAGLDRRQIDLFVLHQPNRVFHDEWCERIGMTRDRVVDTLEQYGNISNCNIPVNLSEALRQGKVKAGQTLCLAAIGEGTGYGAQVWRWTEPVEGRPFSPQSEVQHRDDPKRQLVSMDRFGLEELKNGFVKPGRREKLRWEEAYGESVNVHGHARSVPVEKAWEFLTDPANLEDWSTGVRGLKPMGEWRGRRRFYADHMLNPGGCIYLLHELHPESRTLDMWIGHDPEDIWMRFRIRVHDAEAVMGQPGSVITWTCFAHANHNRNSVLLEGFRLMPVAHQCELENLLKVLTHKYAPSLEVKSGD